ncbi:hypothetical protein GCM10010495_21080 [Kitasatospora herbaricolor]|nr:hypothetical protein GCM10010495_21080 [Kitasatospora herbaricolor]
MVLTFRSLRGWPRWDGAKPHRPWLARGFAIGADGSGRPDPGTAGHRAAGRAARSGRRERIGERWQGGSGPRRGPLAHVRRRSDGTACGKEAATRDGVGLE